MADGAGGRPVWVVYESRYMEKDEIYGYIPSAGSRWYLLLSHV